MPTPFFSTIIPVHNRPRLVISAIESALTQTLGDQEIIVVDDGSTDDTASAIRDRFSGRVLFLQQSNTGPGPARNTGIAAARGEYIAFLDSDDLWFPWTLATYRRVIAGHRSPAFVTGSPRRFHDPAELAAVTDGELRVEAFSDYFASSDRWRWWGVSSFVVRRDVLMSVGGFCDQRMNGEDADLAMRLGTAAGFVHVISPPAFAYREHAVNERAQIERNLDGVRHQIKAELEERYPGGNARKPQRIEILGTFLRPLSLALLKQGRRTDAWELYRRSFAWHVRLGRLRYLLGFPVTAVFSRRGQRN